MIISTCEPTVCPIRPSFQPWMIWPDEETSASNVVFLSHEESNCLPSVVQPVYFTTAVMESVICLPSPLISVCVICLSTEPWPFMSMDGLPFLPSVTFGRFAGMSVTLVPVARSRSLDFDTRVSTMRYEVPEEFESFTPNAMVALIRWALKIL